MPEFHSEPYVYLAGLSHKSALIAWGAFYFKTRTDGRAKLVDDQDLVGADAEAAVAETAHLLDRQPDRRARAVEHDEVVAGAVHLGEFQFHVCFSPA